MCVTKARRLLEALCATLACRRPGKKSGQLPLLFDSEIECEEIEDISKVLLDFRSNCRRV